MATSKIETTNPMSASVTGNGTKTAGQLFNELYALVDFSKLNANSVLEYKKDNALSSFHLMSKDASSATFVHEHTASSYILVDEMRISSSSKWYEATVGASSYSRTDESSTVIPSGASYRIRY